MWETVRKIKSLALDCQQKELGASAANVCPGPAAGDGMKEAAGYYLVVKFLISNARAEGGLMARTTARQNGAVLTAHEATVQTAQVEISVIKVGKRQVTQAMFRQIPYASLIDHETLTLRGTPWGYVRYWWDGCHPGSSYGQEGLHVLWQDGAVLRRAVIFEDVVTPRQKEHSRQQQWAVNGAFILADRSAIAVREVSYTAYPRVHECSIDGVTRRVTLDLGDYTTVVDYWKGKGQGLDVDRQRIAEKVTQESAETARWAHDPATALQAYYQQRLERYQHQSLESEVAERVQEARAIKEQWWQPRQEAYAKLLTREGLEAYTYDRCVKAITDAEMVAQTWTRQYAVLVKELHALPQLFIAV
jgi:hypothetical protein